MTPPPAPPEEPKRCGAPSRTLGPCDLPLGHPEQMHSSAGDGFYAPPEEGKGETRVTPEDFEHLAETVRDSERGSKRVAEIERELFPAPPVACPRCEGLEKVLEEIEENVSGNESAPTKVLASIGRIVRSALSPEGGGR